MKVVLVRPERFELPTYCSGGNRSIHLSYGRVPQVYIVDAGVSNFGYFEVESKPTHTRNAITAAPDTMTRNAKVPIAIPSQ